MLQRLAAIKSTKYIMNITMCVYVKLVQRRHFAQLLFEFQLLRHLHDFIECFLLLSRATSRRREQRVSRDQQQDLHDTLQCIDRSLGLKNLLATILL